MLYNLYAHSFKKIIDTVTNQSPLLTVPELAVRLRLSRQSIYRLIHAGILPATRLGGPSASLRVDRDELEEWLHRSAER